MKGLIEDTPRNYSRNAQPKLAVLQRVCPAYRTSLFKNLCTEPSFHVTLFIGENVPNSKVRSATNLNGINVRKLKTRFLKVGHRTFTWHQGLLSELRKLNPDVILCEGESHFIGYLQAICYKLLYNKNAALIHWCFTSLPGEPMIKPTLGSRVKIFFRKYFDAFLLYSSYSKERLIAQRVVPEMAFIATNVGDVNKFKAAADSLTESPTQARIKLGLPEKFTVLYTGTLDQNKRPDLMLDLSKSLDEDKFNFVLLGSGVMLQTLRDRATKEKLSNVFLPGRVEADLYLYYRASDSLLIPGRGGIVISEAMSFGLPVIVHQADGTEYDLVRNNETGVHLQNGGLEDFRQALLLLRNNPELHRAMQKKSREMVDNQYTTDNMVRQILKAARYAKSERSKALWKTKY